jgi:hypothetical protein
MSTKIPRGCIGEFETAPLVTTSARFAGMSAASYPGRFAFLTDTNRTYASLLTRQGSWNPGVTVYTDLWTWVKQEDEFVATGRGQTVGAVTANLCSYTLPPGSSVTIVATATGLRDTGAELTSRHCFGAYRELAAGIAVVTASTPIAGGADIGATDCTLVVGLNTTIHLQALGVALKTYNWRGKMTIQSMP